MTLERLEATRYVMPLREGGSLPAIVDTEAGQYVVKFRGAGQGGMALVAEVIAAGIAGALSLPVPRAAIVHLAEGFGMGEPNPEIQDLLRASVGINFGLAYLPGALGFDPAADMDRADGDLAAAIVWFDALLSNVDRTVRNPNLLLWQEGLWIIDHGASLYFHHSTDDWQARATDRFAMISQHILLERAGDLRAAHDRLHSRLSEDVLRRIVEDIPDEWLGERAAARRTAYVAYFKARLGGGLEWLEEAEHARARR